VSRPRSKLSHVDLVVSSLDVSLPFYTGLLEPIGWTDLDLVDGEGGTTIHYLSVPGSGVSAIGLRKATSISHRVPYDRFAVGIHHVCIDVPSRDVVDERTEWAREQEAAEILSEPAEHAYTPGYYAVFIGDPDGIKLELLHRPTYWDTVAEEEAP
jgi:catechol 2,3-dioxygenase-like lactoylglutathione lyase family enzyme